jgi:hypothetical protein
MSLQTGTLRELWLNPPREFSPVPFGFWNGDVTVWELAAFTPAQLLAVPGGFPAVLAVVRALDRPVARAPGLLERTFREACVRIFALPGAQRIRRCDLLWFTLSYVGYRRGEAEERKMMAVAEALAPRYSVQDDVREVCESVELTWFETMRRKGLEEGRTEGLQRGRTEGLQQGRAEGLQQGRAEGLQQGLEQGLEQGELRMLRQLLLTCITTRFGAVSADLEAGITAEADSSRLHRAYLQALTAATLDDVVL